LTVSNNGYLLHIFVDESSKCNGVPLSTWIIQQAHKMGLIGASTFRGFEGIGMNGTIQTAKLLDLSCKLPVVVMIFDTSEKIANFLPLIEDKVKEGTVISQPVTIHTLKRYKESG
jgi:PII-like signaling protein